jgi:hypothetical protein
LYQQALGESTEVGVIAATPLYYDPRFWFVSSRGARLVMRNFAGYAYSVAWVYAGKVLAKPSSPKMTGSRAAPGLYEIAHAARKMTSVQVV